MLRRVVIGVLGMLILITGGLLGSAAIWTHSSFDSAGVMSFDVGTIAPGDAALATVIDIDRFGATVDYIGQLGTTRLAVRPADTSRAGSLFVGAAATSDVDAYLKGSPYSVALRAGSDWSVRDVPGAQIPLPPGGQTFWLAKGFGEVSALSVPDQRPLTLVIMNTDGTPTGAVVLAIEFVIPRAGQWALGMAIASGVLVLVGVALLIVAFRMRGRRGRHAADGSSTTVIAAVVDEPVAVVDEPVAVVDEPVAVVDEPVAAEQAPEQPVDIDETAELPVVSVDPEDTHRHDPV